VSNAKNRLAKEKSPYLLQHAENPVDWYPWGEEAFAKARTEDKPLFVSIGYATCHWCHVMERESFEDERIAALLNERFVSIKVDREERPDLDDIYMAAVQLLSGQGGWPMSVFLTPDRKPFFGGTYFPPEDRYGRTGFPTLLERVSEAYRTRRGEIESGADQVARRIASFSETPPGSGLLTAGLVAGAADALLRGFDRTYGGFGRAPKFPHSMGIQLLLRQYRRTGDLRFLEAAGVTLDRMAAGGIYDHLGGGFHRYSTDARWLVPHFEKMLYDQALLVPAYLEAFLLTGQAAYRRVVEETLDYVRRDMTSPEGAFYSTEDADSEGAEGLFYTWTPEEIAVELGEDAALFAAAYGVEPEGNFEERSILHRSATDEALALRFSLPAPEVDGRLERARGRLLASRSRRVRPARDDKVLAGWNGLMISAFARAGSALDEPRFTQAAAAAADFVLARMQHEGRLRRVYMDGQARVPAYLEDYAALVAAAVDLYEATFETRWLAEGVRLAEILRRDFEDQAGGFFGTSEEHRDLIVRPKNAQDGSTPSGNSLAAWGLLRLGRLAGRPEFESAGERTLRTFQALLEEAPGAFHQMLLAVDLYAGPRQEIVIAGPAQAEGTRALLRVVRARFLPHAAVAWTAGEDGTPLPLASGLTAGKSTVDGRPAAYLCRDFTCGAPITDPEALDRALAE